MIADDKKARRRKHDRPPRATRPSWLELRLVQQIAAHRGRIQLGPALRRPPMDGQLNPRVRDGGGARIGDFTWKTKPSESP